MPLTAAGSARREAGREGMKALAALMSASDARVSGRHGQAEAASGEHSVEGI